MHMAHAVHILFQHGKRILSCKGKVPGIIAEEHIARIRMTHHAVGLFGALHHRSHMMMVAEPEASVRCRPAKRVQPFAEPVPLFVIHDMFKATGQDGRVHLPLDRIALLGDIDAVCADRREEIEFAMKLGQIFRKRLSEQEGGEPAARDAQAAQIQLPLQLGRVLRIFVADLAAGIARERHFAHDLAEAVLRAELRHIIVAPADRGDAQKNL